MTDIVAIVLVFGGFFSFLLAISPVGRAVADRIRHGGVGNEQLGNRVDQLIEDVDALRYELVDLNERVDFVERYIAKVREPQRLVGGAEDESVPQ